MSNDIKQTRPDLYVKFKKLSEDVLVSQMDNLGDADIVEMSRVVLQEKVAAEDKKTSNK